MFRFLKTFGQRQSEKAIREFLELFTSEAGESSNVLIMAFVTSAHRRLASRDAEFDKLVNSASGENQHDILLYVLKLNKDIKAAYNAGEHELAAAFKFWNTNFRCMSADSLRPYGFDLWRHARKFFIGAEEVSRRTLEDARAAGNQRLEREMGHELELAGFVPPQFRECT